MVNSLNIKQKALVSKTVKSLGGKILIHSDDVGSVTHFVVGTVDPQQQQPGGAYVALSRNHKQQSAMLMGKWQLSVQWVVDSVAAGEWLDEEKYEIVGDAKAKTLIPGGTMLLSKRPEMFLPDNWPSYFSKAKGCKIWDLDSSCWSSSFFVFGLKISFIGMHDIQIL